VQAIQRVSLLAQTVPSRQQVAFMQRMQNIEKHIRENKLKVGHAPGQTD
jgi:hypothetical protein